VRKRKTRKEASIAIITIMHLTLLYNIQKICGVEDSSNII
jgi:hypothetical protein